MDRRTNKNAVPLGPSLPASSNRRQAPSDPLMEAAKKEWELAFSGSAHTSYRMISEICKFMKLDYQDILMDPSLLKAFAASMVTSADVPPWVETWAKESGRCTGFALKVAARLQKAYPGTYNFEFFSFGGHRVARCARTGILIDSESKSGAYLCPRGKEWATRLDSNRGRFQYDDEGYSTFEETRSSTGTAQKIYPISRELAAGTCLEEVAHQLTIICLFRYVLFPHCSHTVASGILQ